MAKTPSKAKAEAGTAAEGTDQPQQIFETVYNVIVDGETVSPGNPVMLTREQFDDLSATGSIAGEWIEE